MRKTALKTKRKLKKVKNTLLTYLFYGIIGLDATLLLLLFYDFLLTRTSSISTLTYNSTPFYLWYYLISTVLAGVLFGIDVALTVYILRQAGRFSLKAQGASGTGLTIGAFAASCPVCSSLLLSFIGISGGLAVFPFKGLELKTLSVIAFAIPLIFLWRRVKQPNCDGRCPRPRDASFTKGDVLPLAALMLFLVVIVLLFYSLLRTEPVLANVFYPAATGYASSYQTRVQQVSKEVLPTKGFTSSLILGDIVPKMVTYGIIDKEKLQALYKGNMPKEEKSMLDGPTNTPLVINSKNANWIVNILWTIGLSNKMAVNKQSPVFGKDLFNFASTGGWTLGKEQNGGSYFNKYVLIPLTSAQEQRVKSIAENTYRPCCNNSSFFQDCNHGSAAMGLIELGVAQGLPDQEIYKTLLAFNSFWFPQNYVETALYFNVIKKTDWQNVDASVILSKNYSTISGWEQNVDTKVRQIPGLLSTLQQQQGGSCGA